MADTREVTVTMTWTEARALLYTAQWGLDHAKWPSTDYRDAARAARTKVFEAAALADNDARRKNGGSTLSVQRAKADG